MNIFILLANLFFSPTHFLAFICYTFDNYFFLLRTGYATKVFGSSDKNYENWVIRKTFKGHSAGSFGEYICGDFLKLLNYPVIPTLFRRTIFS
jgi:hypothetical protein